MITYQEESYYDIINDILELLYKYHDEAGSYSFELDPDLDSYARMEDANILQFTTVRSSGKIIGYSLYIILPHIHFKTKKFATNNLFFIDKKYRKGFTGIKLLKFSEKALKEKGVNVISMTSKDVPDLSNLLFRNGYTKIETTYCKEL